MNPGAAATAGFLDSAVFVRRVMLAAPAPAAAWLGWCGGFWGRRAEEQPYKFPFSCIVAARRPLPLVCICPRLVSEFRWPVAQHKCREQRTYTRATVLARSRDLLAPDSNRKRSIIAKGQRTYPVKLCVYFLPNFLSPRSQSQRAAVPHPTLFLLFP